MHCNHAMTAPPRSETPALALTMGDVCGIGPEILAKAFVGGHARGAVVVGDAAVMQRALEACGTAWRAQRVRRSGGPAKGADAANLGERPGGCFMLRKRETAPFLRPPCAGARGGL